MSLSKIISEELDRLRGDIIIRSETLGQRASGQTYESIHTENVTEEGGMLVGRFAIGTLATGRQAGKVPYNMPQIIKEWAAYKGITFSDEKEFDRWARAVSWKIRREGSQLWRDVGSNGGYEDVFDTPIAECVERLSQRIGVFYIIKIKNNITDLW